MPKLLTPHELFDRVQAMIGDSLLTAERVFDAELASRNPYIADIIAHTRRFRGKRLRPILLLLFGKTAGRLTDAHPVLAAVVEMIHTATLIHDDVLDQADVRRHVATVHNRWNNETSVLYGDYLFTHAFHLAASLESTLACRLIGRATNRVCEGELTQIRHRGDLAISEQEYLEAVDGKTGALCAVACRLGVIYAGGTSEQVEAADRFGLLLGRAFQIADDLLDLTGAEAETGKTLGTDLAQGKLTLPLIRLLADAEPHERAEWRVLLQEPDAATLLQVVKLCHTRGCLAAAESQARQYIASALRELEHFPDSGPRELLRQMAFCAIERAC